jgi:hypothetical protein
MQAGEKGIVVHLGVGRQSEQSLAAVVPTERAVDWIEVPGSDRRCVGCNPETFFALAKRSFRDDAFGRLVDEAQDSLDGTMRIAHRRVGNVEIDRFGEAMPFDVEGTVFGGDGLAGLANRQQQRFEIVPKLRPIFARRPAKSARMLVADRRGVGIVIQRNEFRTPEQHDLRVRRQHHGRGGLQRRRPPFRWSQRRAPPVMRIDEGSEIAAPRQE